MGCSDVSWAWVDQLRPDGLLLLPLDYGGSHPLVKLRVTEPGRLAGCIVGWTGFMRIQGDMAQAAPWPSRFPDFGGRPPDEVRRLFPVLSRALAGEPLDVDRRTEWWRFRVPGMTSTFF